MEFSAGKHLIADAWGASYEVLNDTALIRRTVMDAVDAGEATLLNLCVHEFSPQGVTAVATLSESHISIHTWPELGYFAVDLFFCGNGNPEKALEIFKTSLCPHGFEVKSMNRGIPNGILHETDSFA